MRVRNQMFDGRLTSDEKEAIMFLGEEKTKPTLAIWRITLGLAKFAKDFLGTSGKIH